MPDGAECYETVQLPDDAIALLRTFRNTPAALGTRRHTLLELEWFTGARLRDLRGLDLRDYHCDEQYVQIVHRPKTETPLKNDIDWQRPVALPRDVCDVVVRYISYHRRETRDDFNRQPLLTTRVGRIAPATVRSDTCMATFPNHY